MMEPLTKEEVKEAIVLTVAAKFSVSLEELQNSYRLSVRQLTPPVQVPTLLAEMVMEDLIEQRLFRAMGDVRTIRIFYFPFGTVNGHFLQSEMKSRIQFRPANFDKLSNEEQWLWDKALGVLDYRGES